MTSRVANVGMAPGCPAPEAEAEQEGTGVTLRYLLVHQAVVSRQHLALALLAPGQGSLCQR